MTCADYTERLNGLIDGELSPEDLAAVTTHLATCPDCRRHLAELARLHAALQRDIPEEDVPPEFRAKILELLDQPAATPPKPRPATIIPFRKRRLRESIAWLTAASAVAAMLAVTFLPRHDESKELMSVRDASLSITLTQTITNSDAPSVPGFRLTAARTSVVAGHPAQVFAYSGADKPITLCVWPANGEPAHGVREVAFKGMKIAYWNDGDEEYWAVTTAPTESLNSFVAAVRKS